MVIKRDKTNTDIPLPDLDIDAFIGEGTVFEGKFTFRGVVRVDGEMKGELICDGTLIVGEKGVLRASVETKDAVIRGRVEGDVNVEGRIELKSPSTVIGDIKAGSLHVEEGVSIKGNINCGRFDKGGEERTGSEEEGEK